MRFFFFLLASFVYVDIYKERKKKLPQIIYNRETHYDRLIYACRPIV